MHGEYNVKNCSLESDYLITEIKPAAKCNRLVRNVGRLWK